MADDTVAPRFGSMKALLGIVAGAGASYGLYKLISGGGFRRTKKSATSEPPSARRGGQPGAAPLQPGSLLAKVSGLDVVCPSVDEKSGKNGPRRLILSLTKSVDYKKKTHNIELEH